MSKLLALIFLFNCTTIVYGQINFSPIGSTYNYTSDNGWAGTKYSSNIFSEKDTLVDGIMYRKLVEIIKKKEFMSTEKESKYINLVRESNDSIFFGNRFTYYLGAKEKDTIKIFKQSRDNYLVLDSIRYKEYFAAVRKVYYFRQIEKDCRYTRKVTFVENYGPIDAYLSLGSINDCYLTDNLADYKYFCGSFEGNTLNKEASEPLSTESEISLIKLIIYPNPATTIINFQLPKSGLLVELFNSLGTKVIETLSVSDQTNAINIASLPAGVYFVKVAGENSKGLHFVKQ